MLASLQERTRRILALDVDSIFNYAFNLPTASWLLDFQLTDEMFVEQRRPKYVAKDDHIAEMCNHRILTRQAEAKLFLKYNYARHCLLKVRRQIQQLPTLKRVEEAERFLTIAQTTRDLIATHNLRLVVHLAGKVDIYGYDLSELINELVLVMMRSIDAFDISYGYRFSTYATVGARKHLARLYSNARRDLLRQTTIDGMDIAVDDASDADISDQQLFTQLMDLAEAGLSARELTILRHFYRLPGYEKLTLDDLGAQYDVTKERIRQLKDKAIRKLRRYFNYARRNCLAREPIAQSVYDN